MALIQAIVPNAYARTAANALSGVAPIPTAIRNKTTPRSAYGSDVVTTRHVYRAARDNRSSPGDEWRKSQYTGTAINDAPMALFEYVWPPETETSTVWPA